MCTSGGVRRSRRAQDVDPQALHRKRCRVHYARNRMARVPRTHGEFVAAAFRSMTDVLAFTAFPVGHWRKTRSNNLLERLIKGDQATLERA